jgi:hypothetical protein
VDQGVEVQCIQSLVVYAHAIDGVDSACVLLITEQSIFILLLISAVTLLSLCCCCFFCIVSLDGSGIVIVSVLSNGHGYPCSTFFCTCPISTLPWKISKLRQIDPKTPGRKENNAKLNKQANNAWKSLQSMHIFRFVLLLPFSLPRVLFLLVGLLLFVLLSLSLCPPLDPEVHITQGVK